MKVIIKKVKPIDVRLEEAIIEAEKLGKEIEKIIITQTEKNELLKLLDLNTGRTYVFGVDCGNLFMGVPIEVEKPIL